MTYRGSLPGSGFFNGQNGQQWQQQPLHNGFDAYGNAQSQFPQHPQPGYNQQPHQQQQLPPPQQQHYPQYQNASFVPIGYPQQSQPQHQPQPQPQPQPQQQVQAINYSAAHMNPSHGFTPSYDQQSHHPNLHQQQQQQQQAQYRRQNANYAAQMGQLQSIVQQPRPQQPNASVATFSPQMQHQVQQAQQQQQQQHTQQRQQQQAQQHNQAQYQPLQNAQQSSMSWQPMPPPAPSPTPSQSMGLPAPSPTQSYQSTPQMTPAKLPIKQEPPQSYSSPQIQQYQAVPSRVNSPHVNSPITAQSPQYPQQLKQNNGRNGSMSSIAGARMDHSARVSASPRLHTQGLPRSPSVGSTRSPAPGLLPHQDTNSLLVCVAEDMFSAARKGVLNVADLLDSKTVQEYQKLIATGLGCLELVLNSNRLAPRLEARLQLRYASILCEETNNVMESETALAKGMALCDKVRLA